VRRERPSAWWANEFVSARRGKLYLGNVPADEVAQRFGTPLFCYGRERVAANFRAVRDAFSSRLHLPVRISYALKANPHPDILKTLRRQGAGIDAVSPEEVEAALAAGFSPGRILFTGTSVSRLDLARMMAVPGLTITIDALEQLDIMRDIAPRRSGRGRIRVSVRWNPGIGGGFNPKVVTAGRVTSSGIPIKFGLDEPKVAVAFERAARLGFKAVGFHQHLGSGWTLDDLPAVRSAVERMVRKAAELEARGVRLEFLDFGGGFGPRYRPGQRLFPVDRYAALIGASLSRAGLRVQAVCFEPGRSLVADAGVLLLRVEYVKESYGHLFACVNSGTFNSVARPAIYTEAQHPLVNASRVSGGPRRRLTVAGNLCESGDVFGKNVLLPLPRRGEILAVLLAGAYCRSMASRFNLRPIPREVLL
jgi:diaminopimelate decarboxylase